MGSLILQTLPYAIAAMAAAPIVLVVSAVIVGKAQRPLRSASLFVLGAVLLDVLLAAALLAFYRAAGMDAGSGEVSAWIDSILGAGFLMLGVKAVFSHQTPDEQATQRARVESLATAGR